MSICSSPGRVPQERSVSTRSINEDRLGLDRVYVQAKRFGKGNTVGRPEVQAFVGSLVGLGATKGVFVATSTFSPQARVAAANIDPAGFSGHSLRAGFATSAVQAGVSTLKVRAQTGHASDAMLARYIRDGELFTDNAAGALL